MSAVLLVWVVFCILLFHWIGLLGEGFGYQANDLVYLKLAVLLWITHGLMSLDAMKKHRSQMGSPIRIVHKGLMLGVLIFDVLLLCAGRPITLWFAAVPLVHALGVLGLWQMDRTRG